jgi:hypothetical protein
MIQLELAWKHQGKAKEIPILPSSSSKLEMRDWPPPIKRANFMIFTIFLFLKLLLVCLVQVQSFKRYFKEHILLLV